MPPGGGVDDDRLTASRTLYFAYAVTERFETAPGLRGTEVDVQTEAFGVSHSGWPATPSAGSVQSTRLGAAGVPVC